MKKSKLTPKQKLFCQEYIKTLNATESAKKAGYSEKTARQQGFENLTKPDIQKYIQNILNSKNNETISSQNEVLESITIIIRDPNAKDSDKLRACELMGKRYGIFKDQVEHSGEVNIKNKLEDYFK